MLKAQQEAAERRRVALLAPMRFQRDWLRAAACSAGLLALNSVTFVGYDQSFPQALGLFYWGPDVREVFAEYEAAELGQTLWLHWGKRWK